jgi:hypothetical protein
MKIGLEKRRTSEGRHRAEEFVSLKPKSARHNTANALEFTLPANNFQVQKKIMKNPTESY